MKTRFSLALILINLMTAGCGQARLGDIAVDPNEAEPIEEPLVRPVTFAQMKERVFAKRCIGCHSVGNRNGLTELENYETVVGVSDFLLPLVTGKAGDEVVPDEQLMPPLPSKRLSALQIQAIEYWIADGQLR